MKARFFTSASLGVALSALPFVGGCSQENANQSASLISTASAEPAGAAILLNTPAANPAAATALPETATEEIVPVPAPALESEKKLPANIKPAGPAAEVIKLAQAGVDETVMLNYITNSASMFSLSSDDIIYLNDLGVASTVVTAMMQHDQTLKTSWPNQAAPPPQVDTQTAQAAAPAYVNPPQPEPQPTPTEAAPVAVTQPANVTYNYFNETLSPYGTWVEIEGYGRCWQPTVVVANRGWRPYSDRGRWVYSDSGWYWLSDYSWGATTFHYGRWFEDPRWGWCWWPDRVWAPSWVSWRYSGDYCGWAPLPPAAYYRTGFGFSYYGRSVGLSFDFGLGASCFTFVPWNRFCDSRPYHHRASRHQVTQIFNQTTIVNNYVTGNNNTVVNRGIPADRVREHTRTELRPVRIREHTESAGTVRGGRGERLDQDGRSLVVSRPRIPETAARPLLTPPPRIESARGSVSGGGGSRIQQTGTPGRDRGAEAARERAGRTTAPAVATRPAATPAPTATSGATRANVPDSRTESLRDRGNPSGGPARPVNGAPTYTRTAPAPSVTPPPQVNPPQNENRGTPRTREDRPDNSNRDRKRDGGQRPVAAPLIVTGSGNPKPAAQTAPPNSVVVIGRRETNPDGNRTIQNDRRPAAPRTETQPNLSRNTQNRAVPAAPAPAQGFASAVPAQPSPTRTYAPPAPQPQRIAREENRFTPAAPSYSRPQQAAPNRAYAAPNPAPVQRNYQSAPVYSAPQPAPAPSYAPAPSRAQNNESRSAPQRSSSGREGGRESGYNRRNN